MGSETRMDHALSVRLMPWTICPSTGARICLAMFWHCEAEVLNIESLQNMERNASGLNM